MEFLKSLLLSGAIGLWLFWLWKRRHLYRFALKFPGQIGVPFFGILYRILICNNLMLVLGKILQECKQHTICIWMGTRPTILTVDPEFIEQVLSLPGQQNKAEGWYTALDYFLDGSVLTKPDKAWLSHRKLINPAFSHKVLLSFLPVFNKAKSLFVMKLATMVDDEEHKLIQLFQHLSLGISVETTMGKPMRLGEEVDVELAPKTTSFVNNICLYTMLNFLHLQWLFILHRNSNKTKQHIWNFVANLIKQKINKSTLISEHNKNEIDNTDVDVLDIKKTPKIFIDQVMKPYENKELTWDEMLSESATILATSFETSSNAIFSVIVMLAMHPTVQERLYEEIVNMFPDKDFEMTYEHMNQLPYLDMVVNETLRLMPSIPLIGRQIVQDTQLNKDLLLPKNMEILISIFDLHRRKDIWGADANKFNPDNFLPGSLRDKHAFAYIPFSKGLRNCIGWRYATFSIKVMIAGLVRNFRFTTNFKYEDIAFLNFISIRYKVEPGLKIHLRN